MNELATTVDFSIIRYANCWEDADLLLAAAATGSTDDVLCIASAGDNALALLSGQVGSVHAIDLSLPQLYLTELKMQAFATLSYEALLAFLGFEPATAAQRLEHFNMVKEKLSPGAKAYWEQHTASIQQGVIHGGKFEHYFRMFRRYFLPLTHGSAAVRELLREKTDAAQQAFYHNTWNNWRWRTLMQLFFSKYVMGRYGRDPEFLKHVQVPVGTYIRQRAAAHLQSADSTRNGFLHYIFTGSFNGYLPLAYRREHFETIRSNLHRLRLSHTGATEAIVQQPYQVYCCSNIFEYMSATEFRDIVKTWAPHMPQGCRLAYWNLMAARSFSAVAPGQFQAETALQERLHRQDKGFFYSNFLAETKL